MLAASAAEFEAKSGAHKNCRSSREERIQTIGLIEQGYEFGEFHVSRQDELIIRESEVIVIFGMMVRWQHYPLCRHALRSCLPAVVGSRYGDRRSWPQPESGSGRSNISVANDP